MSTCDRQGYNFVDEIQLLCQSLATSILTNVFKKDCWRNIAEKGFKYVVESCIYVYVGRVANSVYVS